VALQRDERRTEGEGGKEKKKRALSAISRSGREVAPAHDPTPAGGSP